MKMVSPKASGKSYGWHSLILLSVFVVSLFSCTRQPEPIKVGAIISLTGSGGYLTELRDALLLAVEEINGDGGINGHPIELFVEDSKSDAEEGMKAMERLEAQHHPAFYLSTLSAVSMAVSPMAERLEVPLIGLVTSSLDFTKNKHWSFRYYALSNEEIPPVLAISAKLGVKRLGILYQDEPYGQSVFQLLSAAVGAKEGIDSVGQPFAKNDFNIADKITKLGEVDGLYVVGYVSFIGEVIKQARQAGFNRKIITASGGSAPSVRAMAEAEGVYVASPLLYNENFPYAKKLSDKYVARFGKPLSHQTVVGYDILFLLRSLLQEKPVSRENIKKVLEQGYHFPSAMGDILVPPGSHEINYSLYPAQIKNGAVIFGR